MKKGDVIKKVNGESITNPVRAFELFKGLKGKTEFKILVQKKDGKNQDLHFKVLNGKTNTLIELKKRKK